MWMIWMSLLAGAQEPPRHFVVVQDVSGSMLSEDLLAFPQALYEGLATWPRAGDALGMSTFVGTVEPTQWLPLTRLADRPRGIARRLSSLGVCNCVDEPAFPEPLPPGWCTAAGYDGYDTRPHMVGCWEGATWGSSVGVGIDQAVDSLSTYPGDVRAILVITDGLPEGDDLGLLQAAAFAAADRAAAAGIDVWTHRVGTWPDGDFVADLTRGLGGYWEGDSADLGLAAAEVLAAY
jgi:hypothetical protein